MKLKSIVKRKKNTPPWWRPLVAWFELKRIKLLRVGSRHHTLIVSCVVGLLCSLAASLLKQTVHWTAGLVHSFASSPVEGLLYFILPGVGILLTLLLLKYLVRDDLAHGVPRVLYSLSRKKGYLHPHNTWSSIAASSLTIGFGGSVGAESPIVLTGAAIGSNVARLFRADDRTVMLMVGCGVASGVAAIFNAPLAGLVFTLEVLMLDLTMGSIVPLLVSSVTATLVSTFIQGGAPLFHFTYSVPFDIGNWPYYVLLGVATGFISIYFTNTAMSLGRQFQKIRNDYTRLLVGALSLGLLIWLFPPLYGEGYEYIQLIFEGNVDQLLAHSPLLYLGDSEIFVLLAFTAMFFLKVVAMACTNGAGGVGGSFAPTLFVGAMSGYVLCRTLNLIFEPGLGEANFILVGMAGTMAGVMHAPLLGIFLIAELTEGYVLLVPLMITATVSYITVTSFRKHSIYTEQLAAQGDLITHDKDKAVLTMLQLSRVIEKDLITVRPNQSLGELVHCVAQSKRNIFPVTNENNEFLGTVLLDDIRGVMFEPQNYEKRTVRNFMHAPPEIIAITDPMETVMDKFERSGAWNLPVVSENTYVGFVSKSKIFSAYREILLQFSDEYE